MTAELEQDKVLMIHSFDVGVISLKIWNFLIIPLTSSEVIELLVFSK